MRKSVIALSLILALGLTACGAPGKSQGTTSQSSEATTFTSKPAYAAFDLMSDVEYLSEYPLTDVDTKKEKDGSLSITIRYDVSKTNEDERRILEEADLFFQYETELLSKLSMENNVVISLASIRIFDNKIKNYILGWETKDLEIGWLCDYRNGADINQKDVPLDKIGEILYPERANGKDGENNENSSGNENTEESEED